MEKQKIFWVILSVTVFVVVVLVVGVFLLKNEPAAVAAAPTTPSPRGSLFEFGREPGSAEDDTEVLRFVIGGEGAAAEGSDRTAADGALSAEGASGAVEPPAPSPATAAASSAESPAAERSAAAPARGSAAAPARGSAAAAKPAAPASGSAAAPASGSAAAPASGSAAAPASGSAAAPAAQRSAPAVEYWIQTGSYRSQSRAEELSQALAGKGLVGRVFSFPGADATYFRVRIGPYANKREAEKFLAIVRKMQGLEASYISQVTPNRSAN